ncbi:MAG: hypothetical protein ACOH5I_18580 [Oligoflexus sp.]
MTSLILWSAILSLTMLQVSCSQEVLDDKRQSLKGEAADDADFGSDRQSQSDDLDGVSIPVNISGSYLFCDESEAQAAHQIRCKVANSLAAPKEDLNNYAPDWRFEVQEISSEGIAISALEETVDSDWHFTAELAGADAGLLKDIALKTQVRLSLLQSDTGALQFSAALPGGFSNGRLPEDFRIFYGALGVSSSPYPSARERILPTSNLSYPDLDGCYMACYSNNSDQAVYQVGPDIYVKGQFRVQGAYQGRICQIPGREEENLVEAIDLREKCGELIQSCGPNECWAGGDTGGWFGIASPPPDPEAI